MCQFSSLEALSSARSAERGVRALLIRALRWFAPTFLPPPPLHSPFLSLRLAASQFGASGAALSTAALAATHVALSNASHTALHAVSQVRAALSAVSSSKAIESAAHATEAAVACGRLALLRAAAAAGKSTGSHATTDSHPLTRRMHRLAEALKVSCSAAAARLGVSADAAESFALEAAEASPPRRIAAPLAIALARVARAASEAAAATAIVAAEASKLPLAALPRTLFTHATASVWATTVKVVNMVLRLVITLVTAAAAITCGSRSRALARRFAATTPPRAASFIVFNAERVKQIVPTRLTEAFVAADAATGAHIEQLAEAVTEGLLATAQHAAQYKVHLASKTD